MITHSIDVPITALKMPPTNPNKLDPRRFEALKAGIRAYGFLQPILVRKDMTIVDGVHRVSAATELGITVVPAIVQDLDDNGARIVQIAMNKLRGELDEYSVATTLHDLSLHGVTLDILALTGYEEAAIESLIRAMDAPAPEPRDAGIPESFGDEETLNPKPFVLELTFATRAELMRVKKALRKAAGGKNNPLEKGILALIGGA